MKDTIYLNPFVRKTYNFFYRLSHSENNFVNTNQEIDISFGLPNLYFYEHIKDIIQNLSHNKFKIITPTFGNDKRRDELFSHFQKIGLNANLFPFPYAKYLKTKKYLETAVSGYHLEIQSEKYLYTHGMGGLNFAKDYKMVKYTKWYDSLLLNGPMQKRALEVASKRFNVKLPKMYEVGYLRGDRLLNMKNTFDMSYFCNKYDFKSGVPIILYAPTWGFFSSVKEWIDKVVKICNKLDVYLFIKLHPLMITEKDTNKTDGINWVEKLKNIETDYSNVRILYSQDLDEVMLASNILITDVSGMAMEYMILEKPVVFLPAPKFFQLYGEERPEKWCRPSYEIDSDLGLEKEIKSALYGNGFIYPIDKLVYNKGKSLEVIKNILL